MFGYIIANSEAMTEEQKLRYRACYCGLCRELKLRHGQLSRLTLTYDMTFLILLLNSLYEPEEESGKSRCAVHPLAVHEWWRSAFTAMAADLNVALAYHKGIDDWQDERKPAAYAEIKVLRHSWEEARSRWPRQCRAITDALEELGEIEKQRDPLPDAAANCFGRLMGELFVWKEDYWASTLREFGQALGRFVYMMDACMDQERDRKRGGYNPLLLTDEHMHTPEQQVSMLKMLIGESVVAFEKLPLVQDVDILRNILYSGVWMPFHRKFGRESRTSEQ